MATGRLVILHIQLAVPKKQYTLGDDTKADTVRIFIISLGHETRCTLSKFAVMLAADMLDRRS